MRLNKDEHRRIMLRILADISTDPLLANNLGFKGGTCCYFVYGLDRFSVDLDFDLFDPDKRDKVLQRLDVILGKYGELKMEGNVFARKLRYDNESAALKIDISDRFDINRLNIYEIKDVVSGLPLRILRQEDIFAHKLIALKERYDSKPKNKVVANRDLYDIHFFFKNGWTYNKDILILRSGKPCSKYLAELKDFIQEKVTDKNLLEGLGTLLDEKQRIWVKEHLKAETIKMIAIETAATA